MTYRLKIETRNFEKMEIAKKSVSARYTESITAGPPTTVSGFSLSVYSSACIQRNIAFVPS